MTQTKAISLLSSPSFPFSLLFPSNFDPLFSYLDDSPGFQTSFSKVPFFPKYLSFPNFMYVNIIFILIPPLFKNSKFPVAITWGHCRHFLCHWLFLFLPVLLKMLFLFPSKARRNVVTFISYCFLVYSSTLRIPLTFHTFNLSLFLIFTYA